MRGSVGRTRLGTLGVAAALLLGVAPPAAVGHVQGGGIDDRVVLFAEDAVALPDTAAPLRDDVLRQRTVAVDGLALVALLVEGGRPDPVLHELRTEVGRPLRLVLFDDVVVNVEPVLARSAWLRTPSPFDGYGDHPDPFISWRGTGETSDGDVVEVRLALRPGFEEGSLPTLDGAILGAGTDLQVRPTATPGVHVIEELAGPFDPDPRVLGRRGATLLAFEQQPPATVAQGDTVTISGACDAPRASVMWARSPEPLAGVTHDGVLVKHELDVEGAFSVSTSLREDQLPGRYQVSATCRHGDDQLLTSASWWVEVVGPDPRPTFADLSPTSSHTEAIRTFAWRGVIEGCRPGFFCPDAPATRAQLASLIARALDLGIEPDLTPREPVAVQSIGVAAVTPLGTAAVTGAGSAAAAGAGSVQAGSRFVDVPADYVHAPAIERLAELGVVLGCAADRFCPTTPVRRDQAASMIARAFGYPPVDGPYPHPTLRDVAHDSVHRPAIASLLQWHVVHGCTCDAFCPSRPLTRAEAARLLQRALQLGR